MSRLDPKTHDANGRLISIVDKFSNTTSVQRAGSGEATNIVSPFGVRTQLLMDDNGYLSAVVNPANETNAFRYTANGLLTNVITRKGYVFNFVYDDWGRLVRAEDPAGAYHQFKRENFFAGHEVMDSGTLQGSNTYRFARMGADFSLRTHVAPGNLTTLTYQNYAETIITNIAPDGTVVSTLMGADPRFDWQVKKPEMRTIRFPSGLIWSANVSRAASLSDTGDVLSLVSFTNVFSINDRPAYVASYQASNRMASLTSPEGRTRRVIYNANGRAERIELPGLYPIDVAYDVHGRLQQFAIGTGAVRRAFGLGYTTNGVWGALTNSLLQSYRLDSDPAGRVTNLLQPDAKTIGLRYDKSSNLSGVTPPDKAEHQMDYNNVGLLGRYSAPGLAGVDTNLLLTWNARRQVTSIRLPGGATITNQYNAAGQASQVRWPENRIAVAYANGHPISIVATSGSSLALGWDGSLLTNVTWGGSVTGRVGYAWSPDLRLSRITLNGDGIGYGYDFDLLLTNAGQLRLNRDAASGFVTNAVLGDVSDMRQISKFGELQASASDFGGTNLLSFDYGYDAMWRMTSRVERIQNQTNLYTYSYDAAGRLIEVHTNGSLCAKYQYDANGNRTNAILSGSSLVGHYDAQDRLLGYGATTYQYDDRGTLTNKSVGGVGTAYRYDARGSLLAVSSTVSVIRYSVDPLGRRIAKSVNGTTVQRLVYQDFLKPIAELNADGSVKSRFVYATRVNVPDYMVRSGTTYRIITDHLGSVRLVVDAQTGAVAQQMDYDEWGNVLQDTNPGFQPFGFAGGLYDPDTGLTRFGYRDYDPMTGRWLAKDPILFEGGQANLYLYCHGDPINYIDPNGLLWQGIVSALGGIVAGGGAAIGSLPLVIGGGAVLVIFGIWELLTVPDQIDDVVDNWRDGPVADHLIEVNDLINFEPYPLVTSTPRLK